MLYNNSVMHLSVASRPNLDAAFGALSDPTRRAILARLALGEATVTELAQPFDVTQPAISRHLRVDGTRRPRRLSKAGIETIEAIDQWLGMLRKALAKNYDRLDEVLAEMNTAEIDQENGEKTR
jgi:DNA-binding transcriptional ArsR family regulator